VVALLQLGNQFAKRVNCAGRWRVRRAESGQPFYCTVLDGACWLEVEGQAPLLLEADDFVLVPVMYNFSMRSLVPPDPHTQDGVPAMQADGSFRVGPAEAAVDVQVLVGHCVLGSTDARLLASLLPRVVHVRHEKRFAMLLRLIRDEACAQRPAREAILGRLLEVVFIEALRSSSLSAVPGLARGLADPRLAQALRQMHAAPEQRWSVEQLAKAAALSRTSFFQRFSRELGVAPMAYLLAWRMALAKHLLRQREASVGQIAERVGYGSASAFSVAFSRYVGVPPRDYLCAERISSDAAQLHGTT
jgi:AraC-like DNA-binding protein